MSTPFDYYPAVLYAINKLGEGHTLTAACNLANITVVIFNSYCNRDETLRDLYMDAEQRSHDALADALVNINTSEHGTSDPKMANVLSNNIKWYLAKKNPKRFGERVTVEHDVRVDVTITSALNRAKERTAKLGPPSFIDDAEIVDVTPLVRIPK